MAFTFFMVSVLLLEYLVDLTQTLQFALVAKIFFYYFETWNPWYISLL